MSLGSLCSGNQSFSMAGAEGGWKDGVKGCIWTFCVENDVNPIWAIRREFASVAYFTFTD